jgi:hypothetical protein
MQFFDNLNILDAKTSKLLRRDPFFTLRYKLQLRQED